MVYVNQAAMATACLIFQEKLQIERDPFICQLLLYAQSLRLSSRLLKSQIRVPAGERNKHERVFEFLNR